MIELYDMNFYDRKNFKIIESDLSRSYAIIIYIYIIR